MFDYMIDVFTDIVDCFLNLGLDKLTAGFIKKKEGSALSSREQ